MGVRDSVSYQKNNNLLCYEFCPGFAYIWPTKCLRISDIPVLFVSVHLPLILLYGDMYDFVTLALLCRRYDVAASRKMTTELNVVVAVKH